MKGKIKMVNFETYMTAHIAKIVGTKDLTKISLTKQDIIQAIQLTLTCELYPIILNYVENNIEI